MKNVCVVGCGAIGPIHIEAIKKCKSARLFAICDIDINKKQIADENNAEYYESFDKMLKDDRINSVHICTPHFLHFEMIKKALEAGKSVVCEKPAVMTLDEYENLYNLDGIENVCFVMQNRLNKSIVKLKEIIDGGELGRVLGMKCFLTWHRDKEYYEKDTWRGKLATEGGGVLINQAIHSLDLISYLGGDIAIVRSNMMNYSLSNVIEVEDTFSAYLGMKENSSAIFFATNAYADNDAIELSISFEKGKAAYVFDKLFLNGKEICENEKASIGKVYWGNSHEKLISDYYDNNIYFNINSIDNTMRTMFAMYESAIKGKEIRVK